LAGAGGADRSASIPEVQASIIPRQLAMRQNAARFTFRCGDQVFVGYLEKAIRKYGAPMLHQPSESD
jgi:hypothetical protein